jgi:hydrogenase expression/formation protein HypC
MCLGVPGKIVDTYDAAGLPMGRVDFGGVVKEACLAYVPEAAVGEYVLIHVGFAIGRIDETEAQQSLEFLRGSGLLAGEIDPAATEPS